MYKIIALLPVRNEELFLPTYLSSVSSIADEIIALDDHSTDMSASILEKAGAVVIKSSFKNDGIVNMSQRRKILLKEGRKRGGTHFIWLDADEAFSANFVQNARKYILELSSGEKLFFKWITLWKDIAVYRADFPWGNIYKDFIVFDNPSYDFEDAFLSESRTQGANNKIKKVPESEGVVLHYQFVAWERAQLKQVWYRCRELIEQKKSAKKINSAYSITLDSSKINLKKIESDWIINSFHGISDISRVANDHYKKDLFRWFDEYGIAFFEPLQIWHIDFLRNEFRKRMNRDPVSVSYNKLILTAKRIRDKIKMKKC